jgi:copper oxidase (laccase) domain-containing protein
VTTGGRPALDIRRGLLGQLEAAGIGDVQLMSTCPAEAPELYSHRRDGVTGRFAGAVWLSG